MFLSKRYYRDIEFWKDEITKDVMILDIQQY